MHLLSYSEYILSSLFRHSAQNETGKASSPTDGIKHKKTRCLLENLQMSDHAKTLESRNKQLIHVNVLLSEEFGNIR